MHCEKQMRHQPILCTHCGVQGHADFDPWLLVQISYARQLITLEQRNRVINIMNRFRLPLWHVVCHPSLFWKVCSTALEFTEKATCCWIPSSRQSSVTQARILGHKSSALHWKCDCVAARCMRKMPAVPIFFLCYC